MDTLGLANAEVSPALFPRGFQRRTFRPMAMDIDQSYGVDEVVLVIDAAEVPDRAGFAVVRWGRTLRVQCS